MVFFRLFHRSSCRYLSIRVSNMDSANIHPALEHKCFVMINRRNGDHLSVASQPIDSDRLDNLKLIDRVRGSRYSETFRRIYGTCKCKMVDTQRIATLIHSTYMNRRRHV